MKAVAASSMRLNEFMASSLWVASRSGPAGPLGLGIAAPCALFEQQLVVEACRKSKLRIVV